MHIGSENIGSFVQLQPAHGPNAHGQALTVAVADERPDAQVGNRGYIKGASVSVSGDLGETVRAAVSSGLVARGFSLKPGAPTTLRIEIRSLEFGEQQQVLTVGHRASASVKALALVDGQTAYEQLYRGDAKGAGVFAAGGNTVEQQVNAALTAALEKMMSDPALFSALTQSQATPE